MSRRSERLTRSKMHLLLSKRIQDPMRNTIKFENVMSDAEITKIWTDKNNKYVVFKSDDGFFISAKYYAIISIFTGPMPLPMPFGKPKSFDEAVAAIERYDGSKVKLTKSSSTL